MADKRTTAVLPPRNALTNISSCLVVCFSLGSYSERGKWLTCIYSKRNAKQSMKYEVLFRPTVFGYLFTWTCWASMLKSLQFTESSLLIRIGFLLFWVTCLWREMGDSLVLINENSVLELPAYKAVLENEGWLHMPLPPSSLSWKCLCCLEAFSELVFLLISSLGHLFFRGRIHLFWDHLVFSWDVSTWTQEVHLPSTWWTGIAICIHPSMFFLESRRQHECAVPCLIMIDG